MRYSIIELAVFTVSGNDVPNLAESHHVDKRLRLFTGRVDVRM